jgi:hypothetical protein
MNAETTVTPDVDTLLSLNRDYIEAVAAHFTRRVE